MSRDGKLAPGKGFNQERGAAVVARAAEFLDRRSRWRTAATRR